MQLHVLEDNLRKSKQDFIDDERGPNTRRNELTEYKGYECVNEGCSA